ncbi:RrF2 family transcriptional regulator [Antrihabitans cavernicola]|uniref:Rrf2 family transcriptional regulator n=1 Tax=Antrihabitans cavernicola TaxID=2495913 RepID=A0A5A7SJE5_9NOCA|nr:Rrf2 family transcriptional regulator [Spelaeibacter cavernicola]KAA0024555.1 Rrf2 family transcriptional regulator [Spelaeibacter cavernicola]
MHLTAKADYAVRALVELASSPQQSAKAEAVAAAQAIPGKVLEAVLGELRRGGLVQSRRGPDGGYWLARPASQISIADVIRTIDGPLASVRGERPEDVSYSGSAAPLRHVWVAVRVNMRAVLEQVSIEDIATNQLPEFVDQLTIEPQAWRRRPAPSVDSSSM